jgi:hypothetical protein
MVGSVTCEAEPIYVLEYNQLVLDCLLLYEIETRDGMLTHL